MKILFFLLIPFLSFGQTAKPTTNPNLPTTKADSLVYLYPVNMSYDTVSIWGIVVDVRSPLAPASFNVIVKNFEYENGTKKGGEQWLETPQGVKVVNWRKRLLWFIPKEEWQE